MSADGYKYSKQLLDSLKDLDAFENDITHMPSDPTFKNPLERLTQALDHLKEAEQDAFTEYAQYKAYNDNMAGRSKRLRSLRNDTNIAFQKHLQQTNLDSLKALTSAVQELEKKSSEYASPNGVGFAHAEQGAQNGVGFAHAEQGALAADDTQEIPRVPAEA